MTEEKRNDNTEEILKEYEKLQEKRKKGVPVELGDEIETKAQNVLEKAEIRDESERNNEKEY